MEMSQNARKLEVVSEIKSGTERHNLADQPGNLSQIHAARQAFRVLQFTFVLLPLIAGVDKYFHALTNWDQYVSPLIMKVLGGPGTNLFMKVDGAIEIIVAIGVAIRPRIFAYVVAAWLMGIVINLLTTGHFYDIALRDFALSLSAYALGKLARVNEVKTY
jgi:hypothetical protein